MTQTQTNALGCVSYVSACDATQKCVDGVCETTCTTSEECEETGYCDTTNQICISCGENMIVNAAGTGCECPSSSKECSLNGTDWCCGIDDDCSTTTAGKCIEYVDQCIVTVTQGSAHQHHLVL